MVKLRDAYPEFVEIGQFLGVADRTNQANLFYLAEHHLIKPEAERTVFGVPRQMLTAQITAQGLDFLEDDGGLGAILNIVTVRMDAESIKALLETRIRESNLSKEQKDSVVTKIKGFSGDILRAVVIKLIEKGIERPDQLGNLVNILSQF